MTYPRQGTNKASEVGLNPGNLSLNCIFKIPCCSKSWNKREKADLPKNTVIIA